MSAPTPSVALWMPLFIKEHRAAASTLSHIEHSALCYLRMLLWENDGQVPNDDKFLARHLRLSVKQWRDMRDTILHDCTIVNRLITHAGLIVEINKAKANVEQRRKAGIASANARKTQRDANGRSTSVATDVQRDGNETPTNGQPRAGSGEGEGPFQGEAVQVEIEGGAPFRVVGGAK